uniref:Secreted protein n=1 Tax=Ascaris lumbricoides TaxID=6252 RepID=A0A0M3IID4_ASCLU
MANACGVICWGKLSMQISALGLETDGVVKICFLRKSGGGLMVLNSREHSAQVRSFNFCHVSRQRSS